MSTSKKRKHTELDENAPTAKKRKVGEYDLPVPVEAVDDGWDDGVANNNGLVTYTHDGGYHPIDGYTDMPTEEGQHGETGEAPVYGDEEDDFSWDYDNGAEDDGLEAKDLIAGEDDDRDDLHIPMPSHSSDGLVYKVGRFTLAEDEILLKAIESYVDAQGWTADEGKERLLNNTEYGVNKSNDAWKQIGK